MIFLADASRTGRWVRATALREYGEDVSDQGSEQGVRPKGTLALHIGGSKFSAGVVSSDGSIMLRDRVPTPGRDPWTVIAGLVKRVSAAANDFDISDCGVSISGPVNVRSGTVAPLNIPMWKDFPLAESITELTGKRTVIDNEAKALARGEAWVGATVGESDFLAVYIGSSVSAGLMCGGRVLDGNFGNAGFIGHVLVDSGGRECRCGGRGCLEAYVSSRSIESETGHSAPYAPRTLIERNARLVGRSIASTLALVDVPIVVIGGSVVGTWGDPFLEIVGSEVEARARLEFTHEVDIRPAALGNYGVLVGAAALTRTSLGTES